MKPSTPSYSKMITHHLICLLLLLLLTLPQRPQAQVVGEAALQLMEELAKQEIERTLRDRDTLNAYGHDQDGEGQGWDDHMRTSDMENDSSGQYFYRNSPPPNGPRIGCVCMDGDEMDETGFGACSGHGGVRFWLHRINADSIIPYPTRRHWEHPDELSEQEMANLAAHQPRDEKPMGAAQKEEPVGFWHMLTAMSVCLTLAYFAKMWWDQ